VVASCRSGQQSYESEGNGIFTKHLLEILRCDDGDGLPDELDLYDLFNALKERVKKTARDRLGKDQEPVSQIDGPTGIILAVNERARSRKIEVRQKAWDNLWSHLKESQVSGSYLIREVIRTYISTGKREEASQDFFGAFDDFVRQLTNLQNGQQYTRNPDGPELAKSTKELAQRYCKILVEEYEWSGASHQREQSPGDSLDRTPQRPGGAKMTGGSGYLPPARDQGELRLLSKEDSNYILEEINRVTKYFSQSGKINLVLKQPVSEAQLGAVLRDICSESDAANDDQLQELLQEVFNRFVDRWEQAKVIPSGLAFNLLGRRRE
jgi:hypothetical protein